MRFPIFETLTGDTAVATLVGSQVYENVAPSSVQDSYVVWQVIGGSVENYLGERPGIDNGRIQINCYAKDKATVRDIADAVRYALELQAHQVGQTQSEYIQMEKLYMEMMDFSYWLNR